MILTNFIYCFIELATLIYLLFGISEFRFNQVVTVLIVCSVALFNTYISHYCNETISTILLIINSTIIVFSLFKQNAKTLFLNSLIYYLLTGIISIFSIIIISIATGLSSSKLFLDYTIFIIGGFLNKSLVFIIVFYYRKYSKVTHSKHNSKHILFVIATLLIFLCVVLQFSLIMSIDNSYTRFLTFSITLMLLIIFIIILYFNTKYLKSKEENQYLSSQCSLNSLYTEYRQSIDENRKQLKQITHDSKNTYQVLLDLITNNKTVEAINLIKSVTEQTEKTIVTIWSNNVVLDSILNNQVLNNPSIYYDISATSTLKLLDELDTCILFSNLLDNACAASELSKDKIIKLSIYENEYFYGIEISNSTSSARIDFTMTTKTDKTNHGYGLQNIYQIIKKYNGTYTLKGENYMCNFKILLPKKDGDH